MFKHQGPIPVTNEMTPNQVSDRSGYHLSYNPSARDYGTDTTAIVLGNHTLFFILKGDHRDALDAAADRGDKQAVLDYFIEHIAEAHEMGDHLGALKEGDVLKRDEYGKAHLGEENLARLKQAIEALDVGAEAGSPTP
mgnify:CR=1 FL=1